MSAPTLTESASWLINAGIDDMTRRLSSMTGTPQDIVDLEAALAHEKAKPPLSQRSSRIKPILAKIRKLTGPAEPSSHPVASPAVLPAAAAALEKLRSIIVRHEEAFLAATLGPRLQIGLQCLRAHHAFAIPDQAKRGALKGKKKLVTRDELSPEGFEGWLSTEVQWLKKPTAYKYMTAVRGLGLDHQATEKQVAAALKQLLRKGPVTIALLCNRALEALTPPPPPPPHLEQQEFEFLRQSLSAFRQECEGISLLRPKLDAHPDFKRAATARIYSLLHELTGTHWTPSDDPDPLATIDPDTITL